MELFFNKIAEKSKLKVPETKLQHQQQKFNDYSLNEEKLLTAMKDQSTIATKIKWINFRNDSLEYIMCCNKNECSIKFYDNFIRLVHKIDPNFYDSNIELFQFLHLWTNNDLRDIDMIINRLSRLYEMSTNENNETLKNHLKILTETFILKVIDKHGSGIVIKLRNSFEVICKRTRDYELLYILWVNLFER